VGCSGQLKRSPVGVTDKTKEVVRQDSEHLTHPADEREVRLDLGALVAPVSVFFDLQRSGKVALGYPLSPLSRRKHFANRKRSSGPEVLYAFEGGLLLRWSPLEQLGIIIPLGAGTAELGHARIALENKHAVVSFSECLGRIKRLRVTAQRSIEEPGKRHLV
jgi:hypothetical protein